MKPNDTHDRESLSALFDGELEGEARLFAMRRLSHDGGWQDDCGRWQMVGDALRKQAPIAAPADLAWRVRAAVASEAPVLAPAPSIATVASPTRRPARLWIGGALAASLALVAVVATRGPKPVATPSGPAVAATASVPAATATQAASAPSIEAPAVAATIPPDVAPPARTQLASIERPQARTVASRAGRRSESTTRSEPLSPTTVAVAAFTPPDAANPFHVPATDPLTSRPWPRAALGNATALTASYGVAGENRGESPSFYPFEPRLHGEAGGQTVTP
ncbi:RseA family anti-sigma factor [Lysobacter claricitrinus]|uniref:RseA family anti-sigma factor n=1 Tax=Lysobacter claricitrinus TaxID=3367728 RepID=UPI0037DBC077